jgi:hypothetical protein
MAKISDITKFISLDLFSFDSYSETRYWRNGTSFDQKTDIAEMDARRCQKNG